MASDRENGRASPIGRMKVSKKIHPGERGAIKLVHKYGDRTVCVRYRIDEAGTRRYTTIELLVESAAVQKKPPAVVAIRVGFTETALHATLKAEHARWDRLAKVWRLPRATARRLKLVDRIVDERQRT